MTKAHIRHYLTCITIYVAVAIALNVALYKWLRMDTHTGFRFSEVSHSIQRTLNDVINSPLTMGLRSKFHSLLDVADAETILRYALINWHYRSDSRFWDVSNFPIISMVELRGDCDDYARLSAYVLHYKGRRFVYYVATSVAVSSKGLGHAVAAFYDETRRIVGLADINGWQETSTDQFSVPFDIEKIIVANYPDTKHLSIRTWDLKKLLYTLEVGKQ